MPTVSVFMDVEDPIHPLADDAALDVAALFAVCGVRGSFCVTGEKCRTLAMRDRRDVVDSLKLHCLGLHTNTHSVHPTTMELMAPLDYDEGLKAAKAAEKPGFDSFKSLFARTPAFWGGAGNTWSPEIAEAIKALGIPAYSYALTRVPGGRIHKFNGAIALPQTISISEDDWASETRIDDKVEAALAFIRQRSDTWTGIFVGHPTRLRYSTFWDALFTAGVNREARPHASETPDGVYHRSLDNLGGFLRRLNAEADIVGVDDLLKNEITFRTPSPEELGFFKRETESALRSAAGWVIHQPDLDVSKIVEKTMALAGTLQIEA